MSNAAAIASLFSFIGTHRYIVLLPDLSGDFMINIHIPEFGSKPETFLYQSREVTLPTSTVDDEILMTIVVDETRKNLIMDYFYKWEAAKYSDTTRQFLNYPSKYLRDVIVNILNIDNDNYFTSFKINCYVSSIVFPELNYSEKDKVKLTVRLRMWNKFVTQGV